MINQALLQQILAFRKERDWEQFHNLRTLATSIMLEAAELSEITQWTPDTELAQVVSGKKTKIEEEIADIAILLSYLIHDLQIDLDQAVERKLALNASKYPKDRAKGTSRKYSEL